MSVQTGLHLYEEILLLAVHDEKGSFHSSMHSHALAGALVTELVLRDRLRVVEASRKRSFLEAASLKTTGDPLLDEVLERVGTAKRRAQVKTWVGRIAGTRRLRHRAAERLVERGLLARDEGRILGIIPRVRYPTADPGPEERLVAAMRDALMDDGPSHPHLAVLLSLTASSGILRHLFGRKVLRERRKRIEALKTLEGVPTATREAIVATQAAVVAAVTAATAAAAAG
jgi:golgi phosphoprotein 3